MILTVSRGTDSFLQFLTVVLLFLFVLAITYVTVRVIGKWQKGQAQGANIEILESRSVGTGKYLCIVRAGGKHLLIAVGKDEIHMLAELDGEDLRTDTGDSQTVSFSSVLDRVKNLKK